MPFTRRRRSACGRVWKRRKHVIGAVRIRKNPLRTARIIDGSLTGLREDCSVGRDHARLLQRGCSSRRSWPSTEAAFKPCQPFPTGDYTQTNSPLLLSKQTCPGLHRPPHGSDTPLGATLKCMLCSFTPGMSARCAAITACSASDLVFIIFAKAVRVRAAPAFVLAIFLVTISCLLF